MDYISEASSGFSDGAEPMFAIIGYNNVVYWNSHAGPHNDATGFYTAMNAAINSFPSTNDFSLYKTFNQIEVSRGGSDISDISNLCWSLAGNPITYTIESNSNPGVVTPSINGNTLTLTGSSTSWGISNVTIRATSGSKESLFWSFDVYVFNNEDLILDIEDFETGDFTQFPWTFAYDADWTITTAPYEGSYCARSGVIGDSQRSDMVLTVDYDYPGFISFYKKISTQSSSTQNDYIYFLIDGSIMGQWNGEIDWSKETFELAPGTHLFKWIYLKDDKRASGSDCGWIDYIEFFGTGALPQSSLTAPSNVVTSTLGSDVVITWDSVSGATSYNVYSSSDPYGTFVLDNSSGTFNGTEWTVAAGETKKFYQVTASDGKAEIPKTIIVKKNNFTPSIKTIDPFDIKCISK